MSTILDALKKAEQESNMDRGAGTPWPTPPLMQSPFRRRSRRWWVPLGIVAGLCVAGVVLWQARRPDIAPPADSMFAVPSQPLPETNQPAPPPVAEAPTPGVPAAGQPLMPPVKTPMDTLTQQATANAPPSDDRASENMAAAPPIQPGNQPMPGAAPATAPAIAPAKDPAPRPAETAMAGQPVAVSPDAGKFFKSDPRIDLQALVWAPDSAARFVVINNRLIKEGGSVDNIEVMRINPDDVLLAEGSDRWHEAFKIR